MPTKRASIDEIQSSINEFVKGIPTMQRELFDKIQVLLNDLYLDSDGKIKSTIENLKIIGRIKNALSGVVLSPEYQDKVDSLNDAIKSISNIQTQYYENVFSDFTKPGVVKQIEKVSFDATADQLLGSGVDENVVNMAGDIVESHIRDGSSFTTLVDELKTQMLGDAEVDPKMISYSKQVINDTLSGFSRNYHAIVTQDLNLKWYTYIGALVDTSRPFCRALVSKRYIHESELAKIARGDIDGEKVSLQGLYPGTTGSNLISYCGGYNCTHQMIPVPASSVPTSIRREFEPDVKPDDEEMTSQKPTRK